MHPPSRNDACLLHDRLQNGTRRHVICNTHCHSLRKGLWTDAEEENGVDGGSAGRVGVGREEEALAVAREALDPVPAYALYTDLARRNINEGVVLGVSTSMLHALWSF